MHQSSKKTGSPKIRNLIAFSTFIMLMFGIIVLYQAFNEYDKATQQGKKNAERLVNILSDQIELTFLTVDLTLQRATERQYFNQLFGGQLPEDMAHNFSVWVEDTPQMVAISLINEKGEIELAVHDKKYEGWIDYEGKLSETEPFLMLKRNTNITTSITPHFNKDPKYSNLILVSRRVNKLDGTFGGMVMAAIYSEYFLDFFDSVDYGNQRYVTIMMNDGRDLLANVTHPKNNPDILPYVRYEFMSSHSKSGTTLKEINGSINAISFKKLDNLPLIAAITIDEEDFLGQFWSERIKDISFLAIFTIFGSALSFFALTMARQISRVEESEASAILASQAKSEFLANMSHELRTPLNAIIGFSEMMNSGYFGPLNAKQKERMNDINLCGNHLLHLITDILEFSKGEAGKLEVIEEKVNIAETIDEVVRMLLEKTASKNIDVSVYIADGLPLLFADRRKIKQILLNLLSNAAKFTPQDGNIKISAKIDINGAMNIVIADSGIGIAEEDIPKALSVFGQVHRSKSHEGTGLGLPLCRMFTQLHGGKLLLTSKVGEGTVVRLIFPAQRVIYNNEDPEQDNATSSDKTPMADNNENSATDSNNTASPPPSSAHDASTAATTTAMSDSSTEQQHPVSSPDSNSSEKKAGKAAFKAM